MAVFYLLVLHFLLSPGFSYSVSSRFHAIRRSIPPSHFHRFSRHHSNLTLPFSKRSLSRFSSSVRSSAGEFFNTRGVTGDPCKTSSDCLNGVPCVDFSPRGGTDNNAFLCNACTIDCRCINPFDDAPCTTDSDCPDFELCATSKSFEEPSCLGEFAIANARAVAAVSDIAGFAFESCTRDGHCRDGLVCVKRNADNCPEECDCRPEDGATACKRDSDCKSPEEICLLEFDDARIFAAVCVSERLLRLTAFEIYNNPSGNACFGDEDCADGLECSDTPSDICKAIDCNVCRRATPTVCKANTQCQDPREICAQWKDTGKLDCVSKQAASRGNLIEVPQCEEVLFEEQNVPTSSAPPTSTTIETGSVSMTTAAASASPSASASVGPSASPSASASASVGPSASPSVSGSPSTGPGLIGQGEQGPVTTGAANGGVCVDIGLLEDIGEKDRVYGGRGIKAWVLCDGNGSCASAGHMVEWRGRVMRMGRYCDEVGCMKEVRWVDSPKWRRRWRGKTRTEELVMTALAARWETRAEELLLRMLSGFGV